MKAATEHQETLLQQVGISIHAAREGGDGHGDRRNGSVGISIHAAREGGDDVWGQILAKLDISIHAAREGGDYRSPICRG